MDSHPKDPRARAAITKNGIYMATGGTAKRLNVHKIYHDDETDEFAKELTFEKELEGPIYYLDFSPVQSEI